MTSAPADDGRSQVPDLATLKDPALTPAADRPARFVRVIRAVPTPRGLSRQAIGETDLEMQQIVGYQEIEPDGSFRIKVPADTPIGVSVVDAAGRAFQVHTNWIQVRPGETRTCNGCHSPRRGSALNSAPVAGAHANVLLPADPGESMAETRTRMYPEQMDLRPDPVFTDIWTDPVLAGRTPDPDLVLTYDGLPPGVPAPEDGIINYPEHIHPLWVADRGGVTCATCHNNDVNEDPVSVGLNLSGTIGGTGRLTSYEQLMVGDPVIDPETGLPELRVMDDGEIEVVREPALVETGNSSQSSRTSHLIEKLFEQELRAGYDLTTPPSVDHSGMLRPAELRMVAEWIDLGGQYYNDAHDDADGDGYRSLSEVRGGIRGLSESTFESSVHPVLMEQCAGCHQPFGGLGIPGEPENPDFSPNRFVLTGTVEGDLNVSLSMVDDVCSPETSYLLLYPSSGGTGGLAHPLVNGSPVLQPGGTSYEAIRAWIAAGDCQT